MLDEAERQTLEVLKNFTELMGDFKADLSRSRPSTDQQYDSSLLMDAEQIDRVNINSQNRVGDIGKKLHNI